MKEIKLSHEEFLPFTWRTDNLGRAEFNICTQYKRGKLVKVFIYPRQQEVRDYFYSWEGKADGLWISSYEDLERPWVWTTGWCKEHRCQTLCLYVPNDSAFIWFNVTVGKVQIGFTKTDLKKKPAPSALTKY